MQGTGVAEENHRAGDAFVWLGVDEWTSTFPPGGGGAEASTVCLPANL